MQLIIRMITNYGYSDNIHALIQQLLGVIKVADKYQIIKTGEYHKLPGHQEVLLEIHQNVDFGVVVSLTGTSPVLNTDNEAIFDIAQGSATFNNNIVWIHLEVIQDEKAKVETERT